MHRCGHCTARFKDGTQQMHELFNSFDLPTLTFLTGFAGKSQLFNHVVNAVSRLDIFKGVALMGLFWYTWAQGPANEPPVLQEQRQRRLVLVMIGTVLIGALSRGLQIALNVHQRPVLSNLGLPFPVSGTDALSLNAWNSFPSDHSMFFFALATGLWSVNRAAGTIAFLWTIVVVDLPRVYMGIHYPSDVIFGGLFGFIGMRMFLALPLERFERLLGAWRNAHPGLFLAVLFFASDAIGHLLADFRELAHSFTRVLLQQ
jgi:undecaprenyl-diphosphatase